MKKVVSLIIVAVMCVSFAIPGFTAGIGEGITDSSMVSDNPVNDFYSAISDDEFIGDGAIYVIMHHDISDVGKVYDASCFPELEIESIEDQTGANEGSTKDEYGSEFRNVLRIILADKSRENIISSIQKLQERSNEDIYWAQPLYYVDYEVETDPEVESSSSVYSIHSINNSEENTVESSMFTTGIADLIDLSKAHNLITNGEVVEIAIVDSGVYPHTDLKEYIPDEYEDKVIVPPGGSIVDMTETSMVQCVPVPRLLYARMCLLFLLHLIIAHHTSTI